MQEYKLTLAKRSLALAALLVVVFMTASNTLLGFRRLSLNGNSSWGSVVVGAAVVGAIYLIMDPSFFLPFLGETVLPPSVLTKATPQDATLTVAVGPAPAGATHAVYWAAATSNAVVGNPADAYAGFKNAGVVPIQAGMAVLALTCPAPYTVPGGRTLSRHVHYRWVFASGMLSKVHTENVLCST